MFVILLTPLKLKMKVGLCLYVPLVCVGDKWKRTCTSRKGKMSILTKTTFLQMRHVVANSICWKCIYVIANYPTSFVQQQKFGNKWFDRGLLIMFLVQWFGTCMRIFGKNCGLLFQLNCVHMQQSSTWIDDSGIIGCCSELTHQ
jgi:hypothetical protein